MSISLPKYLGTQWSVMEDLNIVAIPPFVDVETAERLFGIKRRMIWKLLAQRDISGSLVGAKWTISTKSIFNYLKRRKNMGREDSNVQASKRGSD